MTAETPQLSIVIPCYNEAENLTALVDRFKPFYPDVPFELILVDNGSTDPSAEVFKRLRAAQPGFVRVVTIGQNIGYGHGIVTGLKEARAPLLAYTHADSQTPPEDVFRAYQLLTEKKLDPNRYLIKGDRVHRRSEELFLTNGLARVAQCVLGYRLEDINGQPKLFSRSFFLTLEQPPTDFSLDVYMMFMARVGGLAIETFPVSFGVRSHGRSKWAYSIASKFKTILKFLRSICGMSFRHYKHPRRLWARLPRWGRAS